MSSGERGLCRGVRQAALNVWTKGGDGSIPIRGFLFLDILKVIYTARQVEYPRLYHPKEGNNLHCCLLRNKVFPNS